MPDGVSSSAFWRKLGWGGPCSPFVWAVGLGNGCGYLTVLDSKNQAAVEQSCGCQSGLSPCAVLEQLRIVQLPTTVRDACGDPDVACDRAPSCPSPVASQVVEVEVCSSVPKNTNLASSLIGIPIQQGRGCCRGRTLMSVLFLTLFCSEPHLVYP